VKIPPVSYTGLAQPAKRAPVFYPAASAPLWSDQGVSMAGPPGPLRGSEAIPGWIAGYEAQLGLSPDKLQVRAAERKAGGAAMLYRMYPLLFQEDLRGAYRAAAQLLPDPGPRVTLAGDCHLGNFGTLRHQDGETLWSLNDYDQVAPGPVESDLCRAGVSLLLLCQQHDWGESRGRKLLEQMLEGYAEGLREPAAVLGLTRKEAADPVAGLIKKAEKRTQEELLSKWAEPTAHGFRFKLNEEVRPLEPEQNRRLDELLARLGCKDVQVLDRAARSDAGGSSLGLERYYVLAQRRGESLPRVVEFKQVLPCALTSPSPDPKTADAGLLEQGFASLGAPRDLWHATLPSNDGVYLVRERQRARDSLKLEKLDKDEASGLARQVGSVLGRAHSRSAKAVQGWMAGREDAVLESLLRFSAAYALQMAQDAQTL
jgi:hypothetical protein